MEHSSFDPNQPEVYVVVDHRLLLDSITAIVRSAGWTAIPHIDAGGLLAALTPDSFACVILDSRMPGVQGTSLLRKLYADHPKVPVIMIGGDADIESAMEALRSGALDFLVKPFLPEELLDRLAQALEIAKVEHVTRKRIREIRLRIQSLTPREFEVMGFLRQGKPVKRIGFELGVSHKTIQVHRARILHAMRIGSVVQLTNLLHELESLQAPFPRPATTTDRGYPRNDVPDVDSD